MTPEDETKPLSSPVSIFRMPKRTSLVGKRTSTVNRNSLANHAPLSAGRRSSTAGRNSLANRGSLSAGRRGSGNGRWSVASSEHEAQPSPAPTVDVGNSERRRHRWSRNPAQLRSGKIYELERQLQSSQVLEMDEEDEGESPGATASAKQLPKVVTCVDEEDEALLSPIDLAGFLVKKSGALSGTKRRFMVLKEGTLLWYKSEKDSLKDTHPAGFLHLKDVTALRECGQRARSRLSVSIGSRLSVGGRLSVSDGQPSPTPPSQQQQQQPEQPEQQAAPTSLWSAFKKKGALKSLTASHGSAGGAQAPASGKDATSGSASGDEGVSFSVRTTAKEYIFWAEDASERDKWLRALHHNQSVASPVEGLSKTGGGGWGGGDADGGGGSSKGGDSTKSSSGILASFAMKVEKKLVGRAVTSELGKKLLREYCLPETFTLLQAMRDMTSLDPLMPPKHGASIEDTILRIAVKVVLLYRHGHLSSQDFEPVIGVVDTLSEGLVRKYDAVTTPPHTDEADPEHSLYNTHMRVLDAVLREMLKPHISPKNLQALSTAVSYLGDPQTLTRFTTEPKCCVELGKMTEALRQMYGLQPETSI